MKQITYISEQDKDYAKALGDADTLPKLKALLKDYQELAKDGCSIVENMKESDFARWRAGLKKERRGKFAGEDFSKEFGPVMMPQPMFYISIHALNFKVPFGMMYLRLKELGKLSNC